MTARVYKKLEPGNPLGLLQQALETVEENQSLNRKLTEAIRNKIFSARDELDAINKAREAGVLTKDEADRLLAQDEMIMELIHVDDFAPDEIGQARTG